METFDKLGELERADYALFVARVRRRLGVDLSLYREKQMYRRLRSLVDQFGLGSFCEYAEILDRDADEVLVFLDRLTINVSELFRNPDMWERLRRHLLPKMLESGRTLKIWSAGCSTGAEAYTIAMILADEAGAAGARRHELFATDIDAKVLERARSGRFTEEEVRSVPPQIRDRYLSMVDEGVYEVRQRLRDRITFLKHDVLRDPFDEGFDLIICRNVVIYFTDNAKEALFRRFAGALRPGGALFVGNSERIHNYRDLGLTNPLPFFYVSPGASAPRERSTEEDAMRGRAAA